MSSGVMELGRASSPAGKRGSAPVLVRVQELHHLGHEMNARHDDDAGFAPGRLRASARLSPTNIHHGMENLRRSWIVMRKHDRVALSLECKDRPQHASKSGHSNGVMITRSLEDAGGGR